MGKTIRLFFNNKRGVYKGTRAREEAVGNNPDSFTALFSSWIYGWFMTLVIIHLAHNYILTC